MNPGSIRRMQDRNHSVVEARKRVPRVALTMWLTAALLVATVATPAIAMAATVAIQNPIHGEHYQAPFSGPLVVDFTGANPDTYTLTVSGSSYNWASSYVYDGENHSFLETFSPISEPGSYTAVIEDSAATQMASVTFTVLGIDDATITSPDQGQRFFGAYSGGVSVHWSSIADPSDSYAVVIRKNGSNYKTCNYSGTNREGTTTHCSLDVGAGHYVARAVNSWGEVLDDVSFDVVPRLALTDVSVTPTTFYPLIRDDFRDSTTIRFRTNTSSHNRVKVKKSGRTLKRVDLGSQPGGSHRWSWNGKNRAGRKVDPGYYTLQVIANVSGQVEKTNRTVRVNTRVVRKNFSKSKSGTDYRSRGKRLNCNFRHNSGDVLLTCLYGVAWVDYGFDLSPGRLRHTVGGPVIDGGGFRYSRGIVRCHARTDAARRANKLTMRFISNGSHGWSQCWVASVRVRYHYFYRQ